MCIRDRPSPSNYNGPEFITVESQDSSGDNLSDQYAFSDDENDLLPDQRMAQESNGNVIDKMLSHGNISKVSRPTSKPNGHAFRQPTNKTGTRKKRSLKPSPRKRTATPKNNMKLLKKSFKGLSITQVKEVSENVSKEKPESNTTKTKKKKKKTCLLYTSRCV